MFRTNQVEQIPSATQTADPAATLINAVARANLMRRITQPRVEEETVAALAPLFENQLPDRESYLAFVAAYKVEIARRAAAVRALRAQLRAGKPWRDREGEAMSLALRIVWASLDARNLLNLRIAAKAWSKTKRRKTVAADV